MTINLADAVQRTADRTVKQKSSAWLTASVTAVYTDGTLDISTATGSVQKVRRVRSYAAPAVGDVVKVDRTPEGNWLVTGALASSNHDWQALSLASGFTVVGGPTDAPPSVRVTDSGTLQLSGLVKGAAATGGPTQFATLPASVSTAWIIRCAVPTSFTGNVAYVGIFPTGVLNLYPNATHTASTWIQLDGVQGRAR
ncbi:hypothetical protein GCM10009548_01840 [Streptomyces malaysiensis subsp. malaysiensis]|uniref:Phage tail protein n=1 Tax=Streptomyces malaysiensis TaxID=92644 RepID=A0ABX6W969_STRMQ|nr:MULTISPECIES: hypothetical protein [Streptomyces]QPI56351.1 hypothetical protein I1A49_16630 [Streptomyces solisilvae]UHH17838.1 hypothetical protein LUV23_16745 [Streptomyces sp. HNM0561]